MITREQIKAVPILQLLTEPEINAILALYTSSAIMLENTIRKDFEERMRATNETLQQERGNIYDRIDTLIYEATEIDRDGGESTLAYLSRAMYSLKVKADNGRL